MTAGFISLLYDLFDRYFFKKSIFNEGKHFQFGGSIYANI